MDSAAKPSLLRLLLIAWRTFPSYGWRLRYGWAKETRDDA